MGQKHGKAAHGFNSKRTKQLVKETNFSDAEVHALAIHFEGISSKVGGEPAWLDPVVSSSWASSAKAEIVSGVRHSIPPLTRDAHASRNG